MTIEEAPQWNPILLEMCKFEYLDEMNKLVRNIPGDESEVSKIWKDLEGNVLFTAQFSRKNTAQVVEELMRKVATECRPDQVLSREYISAINAMIAILSPPSP